MVAKSAWSILGHHSTYRYPSGSLAEQAKPPANPPPMRSLIKMLLDHCVEDLG